MSKNPIVDAYQNMPTPKCCKKAQPKIVKENTLSSAIILISCILGAIGIVVFSSCNAIPARADVINLDIIATIESNNNPTAYNHRTGATGMYQFLPIAWLDCQNNFPELRKYPFSCARKPQVARLFAKAYFVLVDRYLAHFGIKNTLSNQLACYNQGIKLTRKGILTKESRNYIKKYQQLVRRYEP